MTIELFSQNPKAYEAAINHPIGTSKPFIGFKLAADHPQKD
ncbi:MULTISPECIES: hypothetical protein [Eubacterium]|uniref:Uncharacterized protein n=1 Tax=Eubacterium barkeri TaxID=1528 RepID=A0A1H3FIU9_EUBBA|nr:hypothetical protein [Eubacterium barkeri]SDX90288.1 hypothetical protein SAMN04488579_11068 [Eubacterium barkeri]